MHEWDEAVAHVACKRCAAAPTVKCRRPNGNVLKRPHAVRLYDNMVRTDTGARWPKSGFVVGVTSADKVL